MKILLIFLYFLLQIKAINICIVGGSGGLGKELIYQCLKEQYNVLALSNNPENIKLPYRGGGLSYDNNKEYIFNNNLDNDFLENNIKNNKLIINNYTNNNNNYIDYNNIIIACGGKPFQKDYSDIITNNILFDKNNENNEICKLKNIVLISAHGVGDSLANSNPGIKIMNNLYLQDTYRAKNIQEELVKKYKNNNPETNIKIYRPKALSYGVNLYGAKSRETLAKEIIYHITMKNYKSTL
jgi:hypothetical protein